MYVRNANLKLFVKHQPRISAIAILAIGTLGLAGWIFEIETFRSILPGLPYIQLPTVICLLLAGLALLSLEPERPSMQRRYMGGGLAVAIMLLASLNLAEDVLDADLNLPGRMPTAAALTALLSGGALLLLALPRGVRFSQGLAASITLFSMFALIGYIYDIGYLYDEFLLSAMAFNAAAGFLLLGLGIFTARPSRGMMRLIMDDGPTGVMLRIMLPTAVIMPVALGWLIRRGQIGGLFDRGVGLVLIVGLVVIVFLATVFRAGWMVYNIDRERRKTRAALERANRAYRTLSACNQTLIRAQNESILFERICQIITDIGGYRIAWIGLVSDTDSSAGPQPEPLRMAAQASTYSALPEGIGFDDEHIRDMVQRAIRTRMPQFTHQVQGEAWRTEALRLGYSGAVVLPIRDKERVFGTLNVYSAEVMGFDEEEVALLIELAADIGYGVSTLRNQQRQQAAEEEIRYQAELLQNISDAVIATDLDYSIRSWNAAAERIYGWKPHEVFGRSVREVLDTRYIDDEPGSVLATFEENGIWRGEVLQSTRDGREINVMSSVSVIRNADEQAIGIVAVNRDITELKQTERAALRFEEKFKTLFDESLDIVIILDAETGDIISANSALNRALGYLPDDIIGQHFSIFLPDEEQLQDDELMDQVQTVGAIFASQQFRRADGTLCPMDMTAAVIPWEDQQAVLCTMRDISERLLLEEELIETRLMRRGLEREREVIRMQEEFLAMVSHDFRTPLSVIVSSGDILIRYHDRLTDERRSEHMMIIRDQARYMTTLLDDVLSLSKARAGHLELSLSQIDMSQFCRGLIDEISLQQTNDAGKMHHISLSIEGDLSAASMDARVLRRVVMNLLSNAMKYSPQGTEISLRLSRDNENMCVIVHDQGIGVPEKDLPHLFEPFRRASNAISIEGTGLGLAIVNENVKLLGGTINCTSAEGEGATFTVCLPYRLGDRAD